MAAVQPQHMFGAAPERVAARDAAADDDVPGPHPPLPNTPPEPAPASGAPRA
jgi:hypothetical protein